MITHLPSLTWFISASGNLAAVAAVAGVVVMLALGVRVAPIERKLGLDRVYRYHKILGVAVVLLFIGHGLLRTLAFSLRNSGKWDWSFLFYLSPKRPALLLGHLAIYALVIVAVAALAGRHRIAFRSWKSIHLLVYPIIAVAFAHVLLESSRDLASLKSFGILALLTIPLLGLYGYRVSYVLRREREGTWLVSHLVRETADTTTLVISRSQGAGKFAGRRAGQFAIIRVRDGKRWSDPHPFTISSPPGSPNLAFTIKSAGRFTSAIPSLAPGTPVLCEGPYGIFSVDFASEPEVVMICGGVGITPFLSSIRHAVAIGSKKNITLLCGNRKFDDIIAVEELRAAAERIPLRIVHVLSRPPHDGLPSSSEKIIFERGHIDGDILRKHISSAEASFYLCGPQKMQEDILLALEKTLLIPRAAVKRELFFY